ncbi:UNVERIFIED_CONTAM: hypothetical protein Sangu_1254700 [Sesamum angustifolium]|uniref:Reverse transcriptase RNase H-like domain-containing protein n=1 Tax=Sesamum angustifolium TaxID=2727405 RepID=A0AAW2NL48_9LAMI
MRIWGQWREFPRIHCNPTRHRGQPINILDMEPPTNINEVQQLTGRMVALSRFISKSAEKGLPFFKTLRNVKSLNQSISSLCSEVLNGAECRYSPIERMALALVTTARKLRPYFLLYPVGVRINTPLKQVLGRPEASGRLVKCVIELSEYDISSLPRTTIKA